MAESLDLDAMIRRFRDRATAVKNRPLPPVAGEERTRFIEQAQVDYQDYAIIGDATATVEDGVLVLRVDLRPPDDRSS
jgi:limonene-1,2-epoxide hydrolase